MSILIILFDSDINGQESTSLIFSVKYKVTYTKNNRKIIDDICILDIAKNKSYFYSDGKEKRLKYIREKIEKNNQSGGRLNFEKNEIKNDILRLSVLKLYDNKKAIIVEDVGGQNFGFVKDTLSTNRWNIINEKETFNGLICQKAIMKRDTVLITAWFSKKIPLQEGPLYFYGLPGLIIKAKTNTGFEIELLSTENKVLKKEQIKMPKFILVSEKDVNRAKSNYDAAFKSGRLPNGDIVTPQKN